MLQLQVSMVTVVQAQDASPDLCNLKTKVSALRSSFLVPRPASLVTISLKIQTTESLVTSTKQTISIISLNGELLRNGIQSKTSVLLQVA